MQSDPAARQDLPIGIAARGEYLVSGLTTLLIFRP